jgi:hypothetical protein
MTSEELAVAGLLPNKEEIHDSSNREDREIRSEDKSGVEEELGDIEADPSEFVVAMSAKSYPPAFVFSESKVTADLIREYEAAEFFPVGNGRAPLDEQIPNPEANEVIVFHDFFTCRLRFPCDLVLLAILERFFCKDSLVIAELISRTVQVLLAYKGHVWLEGVLFYVQGILFAWSTK